MKVLPPNPITDAMIVSSSLFETAPATYVAGTTYALGAYASVAGALGEILIYKSLQAGNIGNTPATSPTWWVYSSSTYSPWSFGARFIRGGGYVLGDRVLDTSTKTVYESVASNNTAILDPINSPIWSSAGVINSPVAPLPFNSATTYSIDAVVYIPNFSGNELTGMTVYRSLQNANVGQSIADTAWWALFPEYPLPWIYTVIYPNGSVVYKTDNTLWKSTRTGNQNNTPGTTTANWIKVGPSNRAAMFDAQTSTQSIANKSLSVTITPGIIEAVGLINCLGDTATATLQDGLGGAVVWTQSSGIAGEQVSDWYQYFFNDPTIQRTQVLFTDIPPYNNGHLTITITGGGTVAAGDVLAGRWRDVGLTGFGLQAGITDFSVVKEDEFGANTFTKRGNKKYMNSRDWVKKEGFNRAFNLLRQLPATPCLWLAGDVIDYSEALMLKAFYKDFFIDIDGPDEAYCTLKLIGTI